MPGVHQQNLRAADISWWQKRFGIWLHLMQCMVCYIFRAEFSPQLCQYPWSQRNYISARLHFRKAFILRKNEINGTLHVLKVMYMLKNLPGSWSFEPFPPLPPKFNTLLAIFMMFHWTKRGLNFLNKGLVKTTHISTSCPYYCCICHWMSFHRIWAK